MVQGLVMGAAYMVVSLSLSLLLASGSWRPGGVGILAAVVGGVVYFGLGSLFLLATETPSSRVLLLSSGLLGLLLALVPFILPRLAVYSLGLLVIATGGLVILGTRSSEPAREDLVRRTILHTVTASYHPHLVPVPEVVHRGGGITRYGEGFLLVTGDGEFYRLGWNDGGESLLSKRLALTAPLNRDAFLADHASMNVPRLRTTDLTLDTSAIADKVILAHQHWNREGRCFTLRVSTASLPDPPAAVPSDWQVVFETQPCLPGESIDDIETGGRLAWTREGVLLLSVGDHGFDGRKTPALAQQEDNDYGKVLQLDLSGGREIFSIGHRNPQGLTVDGDGRVWLSEHGPRGGDELNHVVKGGNYGWPFATYGVDYDLDYWPVGPRERNHGGYHAPAQAFVPSIATSNLIEVKGDEFPEWQGDLLLASLYTQSLFRIRRRGEQVIYVEPIQIGRRIRDLAQGSDGRIVLWTDEGDVVVLARARSTPSGGLVFGRCAACHEPGGEGVTALAPSLRGVYQRPVASEEAYPYTNALRQLGGVWTKERLDAFLQDPQGYVPGTSMKIEGVANPAERQALIEYLTSYR
jgi:cytochrome c2